MGSTLTFTATAATTAPIWYLTDVRDVGITSDDGYYHREGTDEVYALIYPRNITDSEIIYVEKMSLWGSAYNNVNNFYNPGSSIPINFNWGNTSFFLIENGYEPYSVYDFVVDSNWRVMTETNLAETTAYYWFCGNKQQRADITIYNAFGKTEQTNKDAVGQYIQENNKYGAESYTAKNQNVWITQGAWKPSTSCSVSWFSPLSNSMTIGDLTSHTAPSSVHINDLIISVVPNIDNISAGGHDDAFASSSFMLFCPVSYLPAGLSFGDPFPVGKSYTSPYEGILDSQGKTPEEILTEGQELSDAANNSEGSAINDLGFEIGEINRLNNIFFPSPVIAIITVFCSFFILLFFVKKGMA